MGAENPLSFDALFQNPEDNDSGTGERCGLQRADPFELFVMLNELALANKTIPQTPLQHRAILKVRDAFSILSHPYLEEWQQEVVQSHIETARQLENRKRVKLTPLERGILVNVASKAGIPCNPKQRRYSYASMPRVSWMQGNWKK